MLFSKIHQNDGSLYPHQIEAKKNILSAWDQFDSVMLQMPTGTGKTYLFTSLLSDLLEYFDSNAYNANILIIAHRTELIEQISNSLNKYGIGHGIIQGSTPQKLGARVQVASIQSVFSSRNEDYVMNKGFDFIIIDEAHHSLAKTYKKLFTVFPKAKKLGVTATPWRLNSESFEPLYEHLITTPQVSEFISRGILSKFQYISVAPESNIIKLTKTIHVSSTGDFVNYELEEAFDKIAIRSRLFDAYKQFTDGKKGIIYAINKQHAANIAQLFTKNGVIAEAIDCDTPKNERERLISQFRKGIVRILVNVDIFTEGFDCPDVSFIQLARPTKSLALYLQQVGRGLRVSKAKDITVILDNVGLYNTFGLPDAYRNWSYSFGKLGKYMAHQDSRLLYDNISKAHPNLGEGNDPMLEVTDSHGNILVEYDATYENSYKCKKHSIIGNDLKYSFVSEFIYHSRHYLLRDLVLLLLEKYVKENNETFFDFVSKSKNKVRCIDGQIITMIVPFEENNEKELSISYNVLPEDRIVDSTGSNWVITKEFPQTLVDLLFKKERINIIEISRYSSFYDNIISPNYELSPEQQILCLQLRIQNKNIYEIASDLGLPSNYIRKYFENYVLLSKESIVNQLEKLVSEKEERIRLEEARKEELRQRAEQAKEEKLNKYIQSFLTIPIEMKRAYNVPFPTYYEKYCNMVKDIANKGNIQEMVLLLTMFKMIEERTIGSSTMYYSNNMAVVFKGIWVRLYGHTRDKECFWTKPFCSLSKEPFCKMQLSSGSRIQETPVSLKNHGAAIRFCTEMNHIMSYGRALVEFKKIILQKLIPQHADRINAFRII